MKCVKVISTLLPKTAVSNLNNITDTSVALSATHNNESIVGTLANRVKATETGKSPTNHSSTATTYGISTDTKYGHTKLTDSYTANNAATTGIAPSSKALLDGLATKSPTNHASEYATYGLGSDVNYGHLKVAVGNGLDVASGSVSLGLADSGKNGAMSSSDFAKLSNIASKATASALGPVMVPTGNGLSVNTSGSISLGLASASVNGAMSSSDFSKLAGIASKATTTALGAVKVPTGNGLSIDSNGSILLGLASASANGAMSSSDFTKLANLGPQIHIGASAPADTTKLWVY